MSEYANDRYEPLSFSPAPPGWRALYGSADGSDSTIIPLVGWGTFHVTVRDKETEELLRDRGNVLEGVILNDQGRLSCALEIMEFCCYLSPEDPDPKPGETAEGRRSRRPGGSPPAHVSQPAERRR
jgi:hypothetical protein